MNRLRASIETIPLKIARIEYSLDRPQWQYFPDGAGIGPAPLHREHIMLDWVDYRKALLGRIGEIGRITPDTVKGYQLLSGAGAKTGRLDAKTRELIALAVSVTARCDGCITVHTAEALRHGATHEDIAEALGVAIAINAGAALVYSARVMDAVQAYENA
jgi:AhpD family alkylhydroperoxidase